MAIFRGVGGSGSSSDNSFLQEVTAQATTATTKASEASASATSASASATSAANSLATIQNTEVTSASFNTGDGVLTLTKLGGATVTADLDGRFLTSYTETNDLSSAVTWANVPDANITESSVTQYLTAANVTSPLTGGTGISIASNGTITNDSPDQTVALTGTGATTVTGTYPNFTVNSTNTTYTIGDGGLTTNDFTDADHTKLNGIEANATADQTGAEIKSAYEAVADTNAFTDAEKTKLSGIEASADVTDTVNVTAAGALMDSEVTNLAQVKAFDSSDYATAAQGSTANSAMQDLVDDTTPQLGGDLDLNGNDITGTGNISITQSSTSTPALHIYNADSSDVASPTIRLERKSGTTVDDDSVGKIEFYGFLESVPPFFSTAEYANITGVLNDADNNSKDGQLDFNLAKDNTLTTVMSVKSTEIELPNATNLNVDGDLTASNVDISTTGSVTTNIATGSGGSGNTKTVNIATGYGTGGTTTVNIAPTSSTTTKQINLNGNVTVDGTVDGRDVATDGARLDTIPYHRVRDDRLSSFNQQLALTTANQNLGQYQNLYHPSTPVETMRFVDIEWTTFWSYISSSNNDIRLSFYLTVPSTVSAVSIGTATAFAPSSYYSVRQSNEAWYWVSGNYEHLFTEFGRVSQSSSGSIKQQVLSVQYSPNNDRTYFCATNNTAPIATGDTVYFHPYAWQNANAQLLVYKDFAEKYRAGSERHNVSFKLPYTDETLTYKLNVKELSSTDSAIVRDARVRITSTGI